MRTRKKGVRVTEYFCAVNFIFRALMRIFGRKRDEVTGE
jgi:hypothetical protein